MTSMTVERDLALPMLGGVHVFAYLYRPTIRRRVSYAKNH
jgi:hypothetical protein